MAPDRDTTRLMQRLAGDAITLTAGLRTPIDLDVVAERLGLQTAWGESRILPAEGQLLRGAAGWTVAVADSKAGRPRARFTMAHEIGHYLLETYGIPRPATEGDYWRTEELCHYFAGHLLVPPVAVGWVAEAPSSGPLEVLRRAALAAKRTAVSPQALSHRLGDEIHCCAFSEISLRPPSPRARGVIRWSVEKNFSWLGMGPRSHVRADHYLAPALAALREAAPGEIRTGYLNGLPAAAVRRFETIWLVGLEPALLERDPDRNLAQLCFPVLRSDRVGAPPLPSAPHPGIECEVISGAATGSRSSVAVAQAADHGARWVASSQGSA